MPASPTPPVWTEPPRRPATFGHRLLFALSLPERLLRSLVGWAAGLVRFVGRLLPRPLRESRFYRVAVDKQLRMLIEDVGGVRVYPQDGPPAEQGYLPRKIIGGAVDNAALILFRASPIWMLLAAADVVKGGAAYTRELVDELKKEGVLDPKARIAGVDDLLNHLADLSGRMAETLDTPPLNVADLKQTVTELREHAEMTGGGLGKVLVTPDDMGRLLTEMREVAAEQGRSLLEVSTGMAIHLAGRAERLATGTAVGLMKGVEVAARMAYREVVVDYFDALDSIRRDGLYRAMNRELSPYWAATRGNFDPRRLTFTELGLSAGRLRRATWRRR